MGAEIEKDSKNAGKTRETANRHAIATQDFHPRRRHYYCGCKCLRGRRGGTPSSSLLSLSALSSLTLGGDVPDVLSAGEAAVDGVARSARREHAHLLERVRHRGQDEKASREHVRDDLETVPRRVEEAFTLRLWREGKSVGGGSSKHDEKVELETRGHSVNPTYLRTWPSCKKLP